MPNSVKEEEPFQQMVLEQSTNGTRTTGYYTGRGKKNRNAFQPKPHNLHKNQLNMNHEL